MSDAARVSIGLLKLSAIVAGTVLTVMFTPIVLAATAVAVAAKMLMNDEL